MGRHREEKSRREAPRGMRTVDDLSTSWLSETVDRAASEVAEFTVTVGSVRFALTMRQTQLQMLIRTALRYTVVSASLLALWHGSGLRKPRSTVSPVTTTVCAGEEDSDGARVR